MPEWATQADRVPEDDAVEHLRLVGVAACSGSTEVEEMYLIQRDDEVTPIGEPVILFAGPRSTLPLLGHPPATRAPSEGA